MYMLHTLTLHHYRLLVTCIEFGTNDLSADLADPRHVCGLELVHDRRSGLSCCGHPSLLDRSSIIFLVHLRVSPGQLTRRLLEDNRGRDEGMYVFVLKPLYFQTQYRCVSTYLPQFLDVPRTHAVVPRLIIPDLLYTRESKCTAGPVLVTVHYLCCFNLHIINITLKLYSMLDDDLSLELTTQYYQ